MLPGGLAAVNALIKAAARGGRDVIALESPTLMRSVTVVQRHASRILPLVADASGPTPGSLREVLAAGARAIVFQPTWSVPSGATLTAERVDVLAEILSDPAHAGVWVIEEDAVGPLGRGATLGMHLPDRVVRVTQYARAFGPDLEIAVVGGPVSIVDPLREAQRSAGLRVSPLLQDTPCLSAAGRRGLRRRRPRRGSVRRPAHRLRRGAPWVRPRRPGSGRPLRRHPGRVRSARRRRARRRGPHGRTDVPRTRRVRW